ncbi:MAG: serine/threonine protein kinase [Isosphaera sp.]|nr:serine/threonine protein kinase [Isosphaera sp.]
MRNHSPRATVPHPSPTGKSVNLDAAGIGQLALRLGLVTEAQVRECLDELGDEKGPAEGLIRLLERKRYLTSFQGGKLLKGDPDGYFLGGYRLLYRIAAGTFGRVYRGDDPRTGQVVAVKVLRNKWMTDKQKVELFLREGKLGKSIRHPNIVSVLEVGQEPRTGQYFIVMEFVEGGNLRDILQIRKTLGPDDALRVLEGCARGLAAAHARGLTHRDIKPTNILISAAGPPKLVDFGLAEISTNEAAGDDVAVDRTVDYAGLERVTGARPGDVRSDIYFLGAVLYECLTGVPLLTPTKDHKARMLPRRYREVEATLAGNGPARGVPPAVMAVLEKMVALDPDARYQTPAQLADALRDCRAALRGPAAGDPRRPAGPPTVFAVETSEKLRAAFRTGFRARGFDRVLLSGDPAQAARQFQEQPYHALVVNAGSVGRDAVAAYNRVLKESDTAGLDVAAVLLLAAEQAEWADDAIPHPRGAVLVFPVGMKKLVQTIRGLVPALTPDRSGGRDGADADPT